MRSATLIRLRLHARSLSRHRRTLASQPAAVEERALSTAAAATVMASQQSTARVGSLDALVVDNAFIRSLPADPELRNVRRQVEGALYSRVSPTPADGVPVLLAVSPSTAALLGLDDAETSSPRFTRVFAGAELLPSFEPWAQCYGGHQFGSWAGQLGDGRAVSLCQARGADPALLWELQLKGAGSTPYSRRADGRAVLRSSVREFAASEAFVALGIPTTRALSLVATGDAVLRDMFYDGNGAPALEPGAVVCRVARSFVRFGTFELPASRGDDALVEKLTTYVVDTFFPGRSRAQFFAEVVARTASVVAAWQSVGFVHGVLNSDNMSIIGDTIDYGPYAFMEAYDPAFVGNTTDIPGRRYCYGRQPQIGLTNCVMLANALFAGGVLTQEEAQDGVNSYGGAYKAAFTARFAAKMGLREDAFDTDLYASLTELMAEDKADFTRLFRTLGRVPSSPAAAGGGGGAAQTDAPSPDAVDSLLQPIASALPASLSPSRRAAWASWVARYRSALAAGAADGRDGGSSQDAVNPLYVPRNYLLQISIEAAEKGDLKPLHRLLDALRAPFTEKAEYEDLAAAPPDWASRPGVCFLSCSS